VVMVEVQVIRANRIPHQPYRQVWISSNSMGGVGGRWIEPKYLDSCESYGGVEAIGTAHQLCRQLLMTLSTLHPFDRRTLVQILLQYGHEVEDIIPYVGEKLAQSLGTDLETLAEEFRQRQAWHRSVFPLAFRPIPLAPTTTQYTLSDDPAKASHPFALELFQQNALAAIMWVTIHGRNRLYCNATFEANFYSQAEGNQLMDHGVLPPELVGK